MSIDNGTHTYYYIKLGKVDNLLVLSLIKLYIYIC